MDTQAAAPQENKEAASSGAKKAPASFKSLIGIKRGMTQVFAPDGRLCGATEVEAGPCVVLGVRSADKDRYQAVRLAFGTVPEGKVSKPVLGQFKAAGLPPARCIREVRVPDAAGFETGQVVDLEGRFASGDYVDVQGTSKGKGFAGVMKRHNFRGLPASHGASDKERSPGALAARRALGRVLPGQRMAGHLGHETVTVQKIEVVGVDAARHRLFLFGSVPGPVGSTIMVSETVKSRKHRVVRKQATVLRDKMGNIIQGKGAKARAQAEAKAAVKPAAKPAEKK